MSVKKIANGWVGVGCCKGWEFSSGSSISTRLTSPHLIQVTGWGGHRGCDQGRSTLGCGRGNFFSLNHLFSDIEMPDKLLSYLAMVSQLLGTDFWKWTPALFQAIFPHTESHHTVPQHFSGHVLTYNVMVGAPGWHSEFVPTARPQGSVILLPVKIQGESPSWQRAQGKRKKDKESHTRQLVSEGMLSCYHIQFLAEVVLRL